MISARAAVLVLALAACSTAVEPATIDGLVVPNEGGDMEGHTPRGFPGSGAGLFVGDDLNPNFPANEGVQVYLTFELGSQPSPGSAAEVISDVLVERGDPFGDLGSLTIEAVEYTSFGPGLFDLDALSEPIVCDRPVEGTISCDVSTILGAAMGQTPTSAQFRLRMERIADGDGEADLAAFFIEDANTNQSGLFNLVVE